MSESACPFCGAALGGSFASAPAPVPPAVRLSRAALFALGTGMLSVTTGCGGEAQGGNGSVVVQPPYGIAIPPHEDAGASDAATDTTVIAPPYGISPPLEDAAVGPEDTGAPHDAAADVFIAPPYGIPPPGH